jgi:hypothetical protein
MNGEHERAVIEARHLRTLLMGAAGMPAVKTDLSTTSQLPAQSTAMATRAHRPDVPAPAAPNEADRRARRHEHALARQRERRRECWRIDYIPSPEAAEIIERLSARSCESYSATLDKAVETCGRVSGIRSQ